MRRLESARNSAQFGSDGTASSARPDSSGNRLPLRVLQPRQAATTFAGMVADVYRPATTRMIQRAIDYMREYGVSQMPVLKAEPPVVTGEVAGSIAAKALMDALFGGRAHLHDRIEKHMGPPLPMVGGGQPVAEAVKMLDRVAQLLPDDPLVAQLSEAFGKEKPVSATSAE